MKLFVPENIKELKTIHKKIYKKDYKVKYLAGATDLTIQINSKEIKADTIIYLGNLDELKNISETADHLKIGALVTFSEILKSKLINEKTSFLAEAAAQCAAPQIRNMGTIGGNIGNGSPAADLLPPLLAGEALVELLTPQGLKTVPLEEIPKGVGETNLNNLDLIKNILLPKPITNGTFIKLGIRDSLVIARINLAMFIKEDRFNTIESCGIALGAVAPTVIRVPEAEKIMIDSSPSLDLFLKVISIISEVASKHLGNRASAPYKREAIKGVAAEAFYRLYPEIMEEMGGVDNRL